MGVLAGPFAAAAALLALSGMFKARRPGATSRALRAAGLAPLAPLARALGVAEIAVGLGALAAGGTVLPALVAAFYTGFAGFVAVTLLRGAPVEDCGCFGGTDSPPTALHLIVNVAAAGVAAAVAVRGDGRLVDTLRDQPLAGVAFLVLAAVVTGLAYAVLTVLPKALDGWRESPLAAVDRP